MAEDVPIRAAAPADVPDATLPLDVAALQALVDPARLPRHIAIIPGGNGRWAKRRGWKDRNKGHEAGVDAIRETIEECARLGVEALSIYAFSRDNWSRPRRETSTLMRFFRKFLIQERDRLTRNDIRLVHSGRREDLPPAVLDELDRTLALTAEAKGMTLNLAVSYGGRDEIARAAAALARRAVAGEIDPRDVTPELFEKGLCQPDLPDPDLLIRTSGERRISDFLLYQISYAELCFLPVLWPDFRLPHLLWAVADFQRRQRRFGRAE